MKAVVVAIAASLFALSGVAQAREVLSVRLETPRPQAEKVIADSQVFNCQGDQCAAVLRTSKPSVRTCSKLAKEVGPIASFGAGEAMLSAEELARCNAAVKPADAVRQAAN